MVEAGSQKLPRIPAIFQEEEILACGRVEGYSGALTRTEHQLCATVPFSDRTV